FAVIPFYSHASSVTVFNGLNFSERNEQVQFHLGVMDLDLALLNDKPTTITDKSSDDEKSFHKSWERSNKLSLMLITFRFADKSLAGTLMAEIKTMKFDGSSSMQNHIIEMTNIAARLRTLGIWMTPSSFSSF
ncbi:hypothetical protein EJD97_008443, partial [Solanum chilense]